MEMQHSVTESHMGRYETATLVFTLHERSSGQRYIIPHQQSICEPVSVKQMHQIVKMVSGTDHPTCTSVKFLLQISFDKPDIKIVNKQRIMVGHSIGHFPGHGTTKSWLYGCAKQNKVFRFKCLLSHSLTGGQCSVECVEWRRCVRVKALLWKV